MPGPDAASEGNSERDGAFSYAAEWHAFTHGVYAGMRGWSARPPKELPQNDDVQKEPHYWKGGYVVGTLVQAALVALAAAVTVLGVF